MRRHVRVDGAEVGLIDQLDHEHAASLHQPSVRVKCMALTLASIVAEPAFAAADLKVGTTPRPGGLSRVRPDVVVGGHAFGLHLGARFARAVHIDDRPEPHLFSSSTASAIVAPPHAIVVSSRAKVEMPGTVSLVTPCAARDTANYTSMTFFMTPGFSAAYAMRCTRTSASPGA